MPRKIGQLKGDLRREGFVLVRTQGSHTIWKHPLMSGVSAAISGNDGGDAKIYQEEEVRKAIDAVRQSQEASPI